MCEKAYRLNTLLTGRISNKSATGFVNMEICYLIGGGNND